MKYLSASTLGITEDERFALIRVKKFLGKIKNPKKLGSARNHHLLEAEKTAPAKFNMNAGVAVYDCGTAGCIGGWMKLNLLGIPLRSKVRIPEDIAYKAEKYIQSFMLGFSGTNLKLKRLFYPRNIFDYDRITSSRAAQEITKFLTTGKATW